MTTITITTSYITLGQMLKFQNLVTSGADVKFFLVNNKILVNNLDENRRGRKLYDGDIIILLNNTYVISQIK